MTERKCSRSDICKGEEDKVKESEEYDVEYYEQRDHGKHRPVLMSTQLSCF